MLENGLRLVVALLGGMGLGLVYFGGLWWTVRRLPTAAWPGLLALGSFWARLLVCGLGFYLITGGQWAPVLVCLLGWLGMRYTLVRRWRMAPNNPDAAALHPGYAE